MINALTFFQPLSQHGSGVVHVVIRRRPEIQKKKPNEYISISSIMTPALLSGGVSDDIMTKNLVSLQYIFSFL